MKSRLSASQLRRRLIALQETAPKRNIKYEAPQQPFDRLLLKLSPLYRRSRELFLKQGGRLEPALLSSPRSLSGAILLENHIQYSPIADELFWLTQNKLESPQRIFELRTLTTSLFHEQNHRILWNFLPGTPLHPSSIRKYLNFIESLVIATDMALSDSLASQVSHSLYSVGCIYDPGTPIRKSLPKKKDYQRYLLSALHATYLYLELYPTRDIERITTAIFGNKNWVKKACQRALQLDRQFTLKTNPIWQSRNSLEIKQFLEKRTDRSLELPDDPFQYGIASFWGEKWLGLLNVS